MTRPKKHLDPIGYRRGNTTSGANRKGNKNGRPPEYPPGTELFVVAIKLSNPEYAVATLLGRGIATKGVREALSLAAASLPPGLPKTRAEAYDYAMTHYRSRRNNATRNTLRLMIAEANQPAETPLEITKDDLVAQADEWDAANPDIQDHPLRREARINQRADDLPIGDKLEDWER